MAVVPRDQRTISRMGSTHKGENYTCNMDDRVRDRAESGHTTGNIRAPRHYKPPKKIAYGSFTTVKMHFKRGAGGGGRGEGGGTVQPSVPGSQQRSTVMFSNSSRSCLTPPRPTPVFTGYRTCHLYLTSWKCFFFFFKVRMVDLHAVKNVQKQATLYDQTSSSNFVCGLFPVV